MEPQIRFCTSDDGTRIAYATFGEGTQQLVVTPSSWQSTNSELDDTYGGPFYNSLAEYCQIVSYDRRGVGLSDRERDDFTFEADVQDLETVVDHLDLKRFILLGNFHLGPAAIAYAARYPQRVSRLILYGTYASGSDLTRDDIKASLTSLARSHWGMGSRALADTTAPGLDGATLDRIAHIYRESVTGDTAANLLEMAYGTDVTELLPKVTMPTLVLHRRGDRAVPFRLGRELTSGLPSARLVTLEGSVHWPWYGDCDSVVQAITAFIDEEQRPRQRRRTSVPRGLVTILFTDMESSTALRRKLGDAQVQELVRTHNGIVRAALGEHDGREIKHTGDGIMASFSSASSALDCSIAIQRGVARHVEEHPEAPLSVYVGLNAGEPIAEDQDLFGTSVDLAARLVDHAQPGQIIASDVVRQLAAGKDFLFADLGETELRGFEDPVKLWEVRWREEG